MLDDATKNAAGPFEVTPQQPAEAASSVAETVSSKTLESLQKELEQVHAERARLLELRSEVMGLIGTDKPERLLHDLRNILNERELLRALAGA